MPRLRDRKEIDLRRKAIFARLDAVDGRLVPIERIKSLAEEAGVFNVGGDHFRQLAKIRMKERHPKLTNEEIGKICADLFPSKRVRMIYKRIDDIDSGRILSFEVLSLAGEAKKLGITRKRLKHRYFQRMHRRHPEYSIKEITRTFRITFCIKIRKNLDAIHKEIKDLIEKIEKNEIPREERKNMKDSGTELDLNRTVFENIVFKRLTFLHPNLTHSEIKKLADEYFPNDRSIARNRINRIYEIVDSLENGKTCLEKIKSIDEEASSTGISIHQFRIHVKERLAGLHPDWNTKQIGKHCEEIFPKQHVREIYARVDDVDSEHVPPHQVKGIMVEVDRARYTHDRFKKHVMTRLRQRHPDLTPAELAKLYRERFNRYALPAKKVQEIQDLAWIQYVEKGKGEHLTLDKIGQQTGVNGRSVAEYILEDFHRRFVEEGKSHEDADIAYSETFPQDEGARLGKLNHRFYERLAAHGHYLIRVKYPDLGPIFWEVALKNQKIADLILPDAYKGGYLRDCFMTSNLDGKTMGDVLGIPPKNADKFTDIIIDFTTRYNNEMFKEKATKYCDGHTLVIVACTGRYPFEDRRPLKLRDNPDVIGLPVAVVFRFLQLPEMHILAAYYGTQMTQKHAFEQLQKFTDVIGKRQHKNRQTLEYKNYLAQRDNEERKRAEIFVLEARQYEEGQFTIHKYEGSR